ncbi:protein kinase domain-containing protein [Kozakia baliensis]|uniref:protein kinase domain-containing protein n=1 Tax=Kozakia baliensis TaxID=153496 RepID=UPI0004984461|nr:hypothetical protein [Kozakia baliensis]AOX20366.1 hypothetical protein A0U90_08715 [Kozakia baliensis]
MSTGSPSFGDRFAAPKELRLAGRFRVNKETPLPPLGGCPAFGASDILSPGANYVALAPLFPSAALQSYAELRHRALLPILAHDEQEGALWGLTSRPPGPPLSASLSLWSESQIIAGIVRPLAALLQYVQSKGLTLRSIRPDNIFIGPSAHQVTLGPLGLALPAFDQPMVFESLASAVCAPAARGQGSIADDVFSLGVLVLTLCLGELPLSHLSDEAILAQRFEAGTADAYMRGRVIHSGLRSLLQAMLSDDPSQRPAPDDLISMEPSKLFSVRLDKRSRSPLALGDVRVRTIRALAWHGARRPEHFIDLLRRHVIDAWLIQEIDQSALAQKIEQTSAALGPAGSSDPEAAVMTLAIHTLDPDAPLFSGGQWFWPDALPAMLAQEALQSAQTNAPRIILPMASQLLDQDVATRTTSNRIETQIFSLAQIARRSGRRGISRVTRLIYDTNPWQFCLSPLCAEQRLCSPLAVMQRLDEDKAAREVEAKPSTREGLLDQQLRAFFESVCARRNVSPPQSASASGVPPWLADIMLLELVQRRITTQPCPGISHFVLPAMLEELKAWRSHQVRKQHEENLKQAADLGDLHQMLAIIEDADSLRSDREAAHHAEEELTATAAELEWESHQQPDMERRDRETSEFIATLSGIGLALASCAIELCG